MTFELGVYSFGNTPVRDGGGPGPTSQAIRDVLGAIRLAEEVGLDFFGVGEHHRHVMPISSPSSVINAAAAVTTRITLGSAVTVLSTDDPVRVYQQHATAAALAPGRVEITAGRDMTIRSRCTATRWTSATRCMRQSWICCWRSTRASGSRGMGRIQHSRCAMPWWCPAQIRR